MAAGTVIVFDYSGTLSPGAAAFGRPDTLQRALALSGLAALGIDATAYWQCIVNPTWRDASVTARPFARYITRQARARLKTGASPLSEEMLAAAAVRFVSAYLAASDISVLWQPILRRLSDRSDVQVVVATDHYAEATGAIIGHLAQLELTGVALADAAPPARSLLVANSADMGWHKADDGFWRRVAAAAGKSAAAVMLIDDFGAGETLASGYASPYDVARRRRATEKALRSARGWSVHLHPFVVADSGQGALAVAVEAVWKHVRSLLHD